MNAGGRIRVSVDKAPLIDYTDASPLVSEYPGFRSYFVATSVDELEITDAKAVYYVRGAGGEVLAEYDGGGALKAEYAYAGGQRVAVLRPGQATGYYLSDHLGSARALYRSDQAAVWAGDYHPFGALEEQAGTESANRFTFTGHEQDAATDLIYAGARYYDAETGRWLSVDPLAKSYPSWSPYNYVLGNPLKLVDPTGKCPWLDNKEACSEAFWNTVHFLVDGITAPNTANAPGPNDQTYSDYQSLDEAYADFQLLSTEEKIAGAVIFGVEKIAERFGGRAGSRLVGNLGDILKKAAKNGDVKVIGRLPVTKVARDWEGHDVLNDPSWTIKRNDAWVEEGIQKNQAFYLASPTSQENLWDAVNNRTTVYGRELGQLGAAGYVRMGDYLIPPALLKSK